MKKDIYLNDNFTINIPRLLETRLLVQANSGGGKSWLIRRLLEQSHGQVQQIVIDMEGEFATLREKYDYVLIGKGGDTSANVRSAPLLARRLLEMKVSAIIDLSELPHYDRKRFVRLFLDSMIDSPKELWTHCLVVVDEAHQFVPEKGESEAASAVIDLCTRGRKRGFCAVLATQRLSKLHKDAAAECNNKLIGRTGLDIDMKRAGEELGFTSKEQVHSLRNLEAGEFYAFGPAMCNEPTKVQIGGVKTSHPKVGSKILSRVTPPTEKIKSVLKQLEDLPQEAEKEAQTIKQLQTEIRQLRNQPRHNPDLPMGVSQWRNHGEKFGYAKFFETEKALMENRIKGLVQVLTHIWKWQTDFPSKDVNLILSAKINPPPKPVFIEPKRERKYPERFPGKGVPISQILREDAEQQKEMGIGERKILIAVAQHDGATREHLTVMTGYKRSSRDAYIQRLQAKGFVRAGNGKINPTSEGIEALGEGYEPLPIGTELQEHLMRTLPEGEKKILGLLIANYPEAVDRERLSDETGYQRSSRDAYIQRLSARQLVEQEGRGMVKASDKLF